MTEEIQSIQAQIAEADAKKAELLAELDARRAKKIAALIEELSDRLEEIGMTPDAMIEALGGKRKASVTQTKTRKPRQARVLKSDPSGPIYKGGAVPVWLADAMFGAGYAPSDKARRAAFIAEHMEAA